MHAGQRIFHQHVLFTRTLTAAGTGATPADGCRRKPFSVPSQSPPAESSPQPFTTADNPYPASPNVDDPSRIQHIHHQLVPLMQDSLSGYPPEQQHQLTQHIVHEISQFAGIDPRQPVGQWRAQHSVQPGQRVYLPPTGNRWAESRATSCCRRTERRKKITICALHRRCDVFIRQGSEWVKLLIWNILY